MVQWRPSGRRKPAANGANMNALRSAGWSAGAGVCLSLLLCLPAAGKDKNKDNPKDLKDENQKLKGQVNSLQQQVDDLKKQLDKARKEAGDRRGMARLVAELRKDNDDLRRQRDDAWRRPTGRDQAAWDRLADLQKENRDLKKRLDDANRAFSADKQSSAYDELRRQLADSRKRVADLESKLRNAEARTLELTFPTPASGDDGSVDTRAVTLHQFAAGGPVRLAVLLPLGSGATLLADRDSPAPAVQVLAPGSGPAEQRGVLRLWLQQGALLASWSGRGDAARWQALLRGAAVFLYDDAGRLVTRATFAAPR